MFLIDIAMILRAGFHAGCPRYSVGLVSFEDVNWVELTCKLSWQTSLKVEPDPMFVSYVCFQEKRGVWQSTIGRMNGQVYSLLMQRAFAYRSSGYRDWVLYADEVRFKPALLDYIAPKNYARLQGNAVDMERVLFGMIGQMDKGYVERVW